MQLLGLGGYHIVNDRFFPLNSSDKQGNNLCLPPPAFPNAFLNQGSYDNKDK